MRWPQLPSESRNPGYLFVTARWRIRAVEASRFKEESVVFVVMHLEMLNQDNTKMEENMVKESLLHNISQGSNLPICIFFFILLTSSLKIAVKKS